jgi:SAM-dependent methyltransferase
MKHESTRAAAQPKLEEDPRHHHVCPWWVGYLIASPLRKLGEDPETILGPLVGPGDTTIDIGSAMGFFSLPLARMVGEHGRVVCVDVQQRMLAGLVRRARRKGLESIIETRLCSQESLGLEDLSGQADLVLAVHVVHEAAYPKRFLTQIVDVLRPGGRLLVIEPRGHVSEAEFEATRHLASDVGLDEIDLTRLRRSTALLFRRHS